MLDCVSGFLSFLLMSISHRLSTLRSVDALIPWAFQWVFPFVIVTKAMTQSIHISTGVTLEHVSRNCWVTYIILLLCNLNTEGRNFCSKT